MKHQIEIETEKQFREEFPEAFDLNPPPRRTFWRWIRWIVWRLMSVVVLSCSAARGITVIIDVNGNVISTYPYPYGQTVVVPVPTGDYRLAAAQAGVMFYQWLMQPTCPPPKPESSTPPTYWQYLPQGYSTP